MFKLFNDALRAEKIEYQHNPFTQYKLKLEKTSRSFLSDEELKAIEDVQLFPAKEWICINSCSFLQHTPEGFAFLIY